MEMSSKELIELSLKVAKPFYILNRTKNKRIQRKQLKKLEQVSGGTFSYFEDEEEMYYADGK
ncbi:hypothetical protein [Terribacillus sp. JSM ZJ617]|uniref:hypothetical protein n=1 Tax=Terribacillus sp. JSM ZJ617 TaxID=3342119 RepID=UPI0035A965A9